MNALAVALALALAVMLGAGTAEPLVGTRADAAEGWLDADVLAPSPHPLRHTSMHTVHCVIEPSEVMTQISHEWPWGG